jgi:hypothetical protein
MVGMLRSWAVLAVGLLLATSVSALAWPATATSGSSSTTAAQRAVVQPKGVSLRPFAEYWGRDRAGMDADMRDLRNAGITWARIDLYYTSSPNPAFDAAIASAKAHGVRVLVTVHKSAPLKDVGTRADRGVYRTWLAAMVKRYKYHVRHWEIQNEPNLRYEWTIDSSATSDQTVYETSVKRYLTVLRDAFGVIRANEPGARVLFGGLSEWRVERYLDVVLTTDAYRYFDVMSFHPYGRTPDRLVRRFDAVKNKLASNPGYATKAIWVTETGFNTTWTNKVGYVGSETTKADYLRRSLVRLRQAGARLPIFWYTLHENKPSSGYGLTLRDRSTGSVQYLPAYAAYRDLVF